MSKRRTLHLNANIINAGTHPAAWRVAEDPAAYLKGDYYVEIARVAERGRLDAIFLSDQPALRPEFAARPTQALDPLVVFSYVAAATQHIGLVFTASTTYNHPYNLARRTASLDHLSNGRVGLNLVTTYNPDAAGNFGHDHRPEKSGRYDRANEFTAVLNKLWDSWEDDALIADRASGVFADRSRVHAINHVGEHFRVKGALGAPRSPQGRPVLLQAGSSEGGKAFAARYADAVFTAQTVLEAGRDFYSEIRNLARGFGRDPDSVLILPGLFPIVGDTEQAAIQRKRELDELHSDAPNVAGLAGQLGLDPAELELDRPLPPDLLERHHELPGARGFYEATVQLAYRYNLTVRQLLEQGFAGHRRIVGSAEQVADSIEEWFRERAADGFNLNFDAGAEGLALFVDQVVPILQERELFRREYEETTLRERYGLPHVPSQFTSVKAAANG